MASPLSRRLPLLRRRLLERRRETLARVARTERELRGLGESVEPEFEDEAQEEASALLLMRLDQHERTIITAIDQALDRIANGTYGRCASCRDPIAVGRLDAIPEAATCVACADADGR
jgi:RNA polymerase-binding protein DksA